MADVVGASRQMVFGSADGVPNFSCRVFTLEPGGHTPYHDHESEHMNYILAGSGALIDKDGTEHALVAGDFAFVEPHEKHQFINRSTSEGFQFICVVPKQYE